MGADVRVVRLMRKIIRDQNDKNIVDETEQSDYFATDYFDVMKVEKKELSSSFTSIIGIWPDEKIDVLDVAAQSYSLYCSSEMMELEKDREECGDPFLLEDKNNYFLSIIQVHITPEVFSRALGEQSAEELIEAVYKDLHTAISEFVSLCKGGTFVYRIYKMLSAGDFAVVIRSAEAETSFKVSSLLRRRIMEGTGHGKIVLYKTYTLLTFGSDIIGQEIEEQRENNEDSHEKVIRNDRFVLRCCYSNLYWSNKENIDEFLEKNNMLSGVSLYGLNGRYDFSVRITEKQFLELLDDIKAYKETGRQLQKKKQAASVNAEAGGTSGEDGIVKYMRYLMKHHYLSYINERYLVAQDENNDKLNDLYKDRISAMIYAAPVGSRNDFLDYKIGEMYHAVAKKCQIVRNKVIRINDYLKNMGHYMNLLDKLIKLCYGINGFSDTRIYAAVLLEQLEVIMDSIEVYVEMYHRAKEDEEILCLLEEYIRESVCALDGYAQYIRNNNLQSLQTPNYNIESNMSMEKLLIGYSEFLKVFTEFYQRRKMGLVSGEGSCEYLPIVVPVLSSRDLSVETLFQKGVMDEWAKEEEIRKELSQKGDRSCLVIRVPTLSELGNVRTMVTSLFHEVAHQFRYEPRKVRNDALLRHVVRTVMRDIRNNLIQKLQNDTGLRDWNNNFGRSLEDSLIEAYLETNYINEDGLLEYSFQEAPLSNFQYCLGRDLCNVLDRWEQKNDLKSVLCTFLKEIVHHYQPDNSRCPDAIPILDELIGQMETEEDKEALSEQIVKCAYGLSWECACQNVSIDVCCVWESMGFREWIMDENKFVYEEKWEEAFGQIEKEGTNNKKIWNNFFQFSSWIYDLCGNDEKVKTYKNNKRTEFLAKAYEKMCREWAGERMQRDLASDYDSLLSSMGRALGIDCNTKGNYRIFEEQITFVVSQNMDWMKKMAAWRIGKYREETADMFMCNAMNLTPFGYMHMLAIGWPSNQELSRAHYNRSQNILLFQWCLNDKQQLSYEKFRELCVSLVEMLEKAIHKTCQRMIDFGIELRGLPDEEGISLVWDSEEDEKQVIGILDRAEELAEYCKYVEKELFTQENLSIKYERKMIKFYGIMAHMMEQLIDQGMDQIDYFNDFKELRDDYIRGIGKLKDLNCEMRTDGEPLVRQLGEFCKEIGALQNEPYLLEENVEKRGKMNASSIEFLLNMYYVNKRRVAQQIGGEKCHS